MMTRTKTDLLATDSQILVASRTDPRRFELIFERYYRTIHRYLFRRAGGDIAEDLACATFTEAFAARHRYDATSVDARPWLYGIAANLLRRHRRTELRRLRAYARTGVDAVVGEVMGAADVRMDAASAGPRIARALASLSARERDVLLLVVWEELTYAQVGEALGIPIGTVRSRLNRARKKVREQLGVGGQLANERRFPQAESDGLDG
jgi:RNA polymerase sigma-70 factor, ECF subfamily